MPALRKAIRLLRDTKKKSMSCKPRLYVLDCVAHELTAAAA
jgi:hypothetical protein